MMVSDFIFVFFPPIQTFLLAWISKCTSRQNSKKEQISDCFAVMVAQIARKVMMCHNERNALLWTHQAWHKRHSRSRCALKELPNAPGYWTCRAINTKLFHHQIGVCIYVVQEPKNGYLDQGCPDSNSQPERNSLFAEMQKISKHLQTQSALVYFSRHQTKMM